MERKAQEGESFPSFFQKSPNLSKPSQPFKIFRLPSLLHLSPTLRISSLAVLGAERIFLFVDSTLCSLSSGFRVLESSMDTLPTEAQETDNSPLDLVVLQRNNFEGSTSFSPVPEESLDGPLPLSHSDAKDDSVPGFSLIADEQLSDGQSSSPSASNLNGSTPPPPLKTLADQFLSPQSSQAVEHSVISDTITVDGNNSETSWAGNEEAQEDEPPPSSPDNLIGQNLSNYGSHGTGRWSPFTPPWSNSQWPKWSASSEARVYSDWLETKPYNVVRIFLRIC